jgi:hypothetical protein
MNGLPSGFLPVAFFHLLLSFCFSRFIDFPPAHATFRDLMIGMDHIRSSVFKFLPPSSRVFKLL